MTSLSELHESLPRSETFDDRESIKVGTNSVLLFGVFEQRSEAYDDWLRVFGTGSVYEIQPGDDLHNVRIPKFCENWISMRNQKDLLSFVTSLNADEIYVDITGLPHHVWMPVVRVCVESGYKTNCIYVEPRTYTYNPNPKPGEFFDLSEASHGLKALPTFARLRTKHAEESTLIPLLGFEGIRFRHVIERIEPSERDILPVVGAPGFELEYPFHTFEGNAAVLSHTRSWQRVSYIDAACPFSLYAHLERLRKKSPEKHFQIATIGTKPHALGAMLFAMNNISVELIYDHPVKRKERTQGATRCHLYRVSDFLKNCESL